jgi:hypothetical protein
MQRAARGGARGGVGLSMVGLRRCQKWRGNGEVTKSGARDRE